MQVIIATLLLVLPWTVVAGDLSTNYFISQSYIETSANAVRGQGFDGTEAGFRAAYRVTDNLDAKGFVAYRKAWGENPLQVDYLYLDLFDSSNTASAGVRVGRMFLPYGFYGDTRSDPAHRHGVIPPQHIIWSHNQALYDYGDGYQMYLVGSLGDMTYKMEAGYTTHSEPQPQVDYARNHIGVEVTKVPVETKHIEVNYQEWRFRWDHLRPTMHIRVSDQHWEEELLPQLGVDLPKEYWLTGDFTQTFNLYYWGLQYSAGLISLTYEHVDWHYLGTGTDALYYQYLGSDTPKGKVVLDNILLHIHPTRQMTLYAGRGSSKKEERLVGAGVDGWDQYAGITIAYKKHYTVKAQVVDAHTVRHLTYYENPDRSLWKEDHKIYGVSLTYSR